jgi:hypothetical protein
MNEPILTDDEWKNLFTPILTDDELENLFIINFLDGGVFEPINPSDDEWFFN